MEIRLVERMSEFESLRPAWDVAHALDPHASVFMSWSWLRGWFDVTPYPWSVLAVRQDARSPFVAFLPISLRGRGPLYRMDQVREIHMAGDPGADYTGFVCVPQFEKLAIETLAAFIGEELPWDRIRLKEVNDPRVGMFLEALPQRVCQIHDHQGTCCPYIPLPSTWDEYTQTCLSYETRKSLRKKLRLVERECRVTQMNGEDSDAHIDALVALAGLRKHDSPNENLPRCKRIFQSAASGGIASVSIIWKGDQPIAGMGSFIDAKAGSLCFYLTGFDDRFSEYSPGRVVNALCIQQAIDRKLPVLDFLRGDEPYKFQFGAQRRYTRHINVVRRGLHTATRLTMNRMREKLRL